MGAKVRRIRLKKRARGEERGRGVRREGDKGERGE
jgi:hypothetical protein